MGEIEFDWVWIKPDGCCAAIHVEFTPEQLKKYGWPEKKQRRDLAKFCSEGIKNGYEPRRMPHDEASALIRSSFAPTPEPAR